MNVVVCAGTDLRYWPWDYFRYLFRYIKKQWTNNENIIKINEQVAISNDWYIYVEIIRAIK